jgi:hypothetical protein
MPWMERSVRERRLRLVARVPIGRPDNVCRDFGVSRKTGYFDLEQKTLQPRDNPFGTRLSPLSWVHAPGTWCYLCVRAGQGIWDLLAGHARR